MVWKKILYERQPFPDNYVEPEQFLDGLKKNLHTKTYELSHLVLESGVVAQELSCVCLFIGLYWFIQEGQLHPLTLFAVSTFFTVAGFTITALFLSAHHHKAWHDRLIDFTVRCLWPAILFVLFLCGVSPVLYTLTESISTDTVWAMTAGMMLAHLVLHNYGSEGAMVSSAISLNASVFGSVCLASRLPSSLHAFVIVVFAVQMFALFPEFRLQCKSTYPSTLPLMTVLLVFLTLPLLVSITLTGTVFYLLAIVAVSLLCPVWLYRLQHLKNNIYGPWDEATIQN